jgi:hypothetical protein
MGYLIYGGEVAVQVDDWGLEHLQAVIITKLRRDETFSFSWDGEPGIGGVETEGAAGAPGTIWLSRSSTLYFRYSGERSQTLNRRWLLALTKAANGAGGLRLVPEPD